jgi:hypothetical protein
MFSKIMPPPYKGKKLLACYGKRRDNAPAMLPCGSCRDWMSHTFARREADPAGGIAVIYTCSQCGTETLWGLEEPDKPKPTKKTKKDKK